MRPSSPRPETPAEAPSRARLSELAHWVQTHRWAVAFGAVGAALVAQRLVALDSAPTGLYNDEAAFGYNAWAVATTGVDEHGAHLPLFFESFRDYKSPIYVYLLAPLTRLFGLTPAVERLPAALSGIAVCALLALAARRITGSRMVALLVLLTAAVEPWLVVENRVGFDVNMVVLCIAGAIWALSRAAEHRPMWFLYTGLWLAAAVFAYQTGRVFGPMLWVVLALSFGAPSRRFRWWILSAVPLIAAYAVLLPYSLAHPGSLGARFSSVSVLSGNASLLTGIRRFFTNYFQYWGPPFLATHGDANLRHNSGFGGELLVVTLPAVLLGIGVCVVRWREPLPRFALLGLVFAPVPAALSMEGTPHAVRGAVMLPFLLLVSVYGWQRLLPWLTSRRVVAGVLAVAAVVEVTVFFNDLYHYWPQRSALAFEAGLGPAIVAAHQLAGGGHQVVVSDRFEAPSIFVYFSLHADPREVSVRGPSALGVRIGTPSSASPGDIVVVGPDEQAPQGASLLWQYTVTMDRPVDDFGAPSSSQVVTASVWRR